MIISSVARESAPEETDRMGRVAFKQPALSVCNIDMPDQRGVTIDELRIEHLGACGQAHHAAGDYVTYARQSGLNVQVVWRSEDE